MAQVEPPSTLCPSANFLIGKDSKGHWVVQDQSGLHGGLFVSRAQALKYALFENGRKLQAVIMVPGVLELDTGRASLTAQRSALNDSTPPSHARAA